MTNTSIAKNLNIKATVLTFKDGLISFQTYDDGKAGEIIYVFNNDTCGRALIMNLQSDIRSRAECECWFVLECGFHSFKCLLQYIKKSYKIC